MTSEQAFLDAILAAPESDAPRLVYADWMEEHGDPARSEFIRVQCAIAAMENYPGERWCAYANGLIRDGAMECRSPKCTPCRLRRRERNLRKHHECDWRMEIYGPISEIRIAESLRTGKPISGPWWEPPFMATFRRGFIDSISLAAAVFRRKGAAAAIFRAAPVTRVALSDLEPAEWIDSDQACYSWDCWGCLGAYRWFLADELIAAMPVDGRIFPEGERDGQATYSTRDAALDALSTACVTWGRAQAGLPPLDAVKRREKAI